MTALYYLAGQAYHEIGNHKREMEIYELALDKFPDYYGIIDQQAICAVSRGDKEEADMYLNRYKSVRKNIGRADYWTNLNIGNIYQKGGDNDTALEIFRSLAKQNPDEPLCKRCLADILITSDINVEEGIQFADEGFLLNPADYNFLYLKGLGYFKQGRLQEAYEIIRSSWESRVNYYHEHYTLLKEIEQVIKDVDQRSGL